MTSAPPGRMLDPCPLRPRPYVPPRASGGGGDLAALGRRHVARRARRLAIPTAAWSLAAAAGLGDQTAMVPLIAAGAGEAAVVGYAQGRALRPSLPGLDQRAWVAATAAAAALAWAIGLAPSAFHDELSGWPIPLLAILGLVAGVVLLCSIGAAQAAILRRHVRGAGRWIGANVAGWLAGLAIPFVALALAVAAAGGTPEPPRAGGTTSRPTRASPSRSGPTGGPPAPWWLGGAEREAAWRRLCEANRHLAPLARRAGREIPVIRLERAPRA
jgi:hypothetical protein